MGFTDWQRTGIFPLQDHEADIPIHARAMLVGGRVHKIPDPAKDASPGVAEFAKVNGLGSLGDLHPWSFWQTAARGARGMGSWSMAWAGMTMGGAKGGFGKNRTGTPPSASLVLPIRAGGTPLTIDSRYAVKAPGWSKCLPTLPQGTMVMVMPATNEDVQVDVMLHADPRLIAPHTEGPGEAGTLVCDLQPEGEICMDGSGPGLPKGRHARLQGMMRVIALDTVPKMDAVGSGNGLAWNLDLTDNEGLPGYGMIWAQMIPKDITKAKGPITPPGGFTLPIPITQAPGFFPKGGGDAPGSGGPGGAGGGGDSAGARSPCSTGEYKKKKKSDPSGTVVYGVSFMAQMNACGPFHAGSEDDKHNFGLDRDGHPINSGHLSTNAYFFRDKDDDGPLFFEGDYDKPPPQPLVTQVHLLWDEKEKHAWCGTGKEGEEREGTWKWIAESAHMVPKTSGKLIPVPRGDIIFPPSKGPITQNDFLGGDSIPGLIVPLVGMVDPTHHSLWEVFHPMTEGFAALSFRPQLMVAGYNSFVHNSQFSRDDLDADEERRPQVIALRTWGKQSASGDWVYQSRPEVSRARGGTTHGGILFSPPAYQLEDYLGINSVQDVRAAANTSYVTCAPGVSFALGTPATDGGLQIKSIVIGQDPTDTADDQLQIRQINSSGTAVSLLEGKVDQSSGEVLVDLASGGNQAIRIPRGSTAQRPTEIAPVGGEMRISTEGSIDTPEFYDVKGAQWRQLSVNPLFEPAFGDLVEFTAANSFTYEHGGNNPNVSVFDSDGVQIEVCVTHLTSTIVALTFNGTITNGQLVLS